MSEAAVQLILPSDVLLPLVEQVVEQVVARFEEAKVAVPDRLGFSEPEAARMLGLAPHSLRDERLRGRISGCRIVGNKIRYERAELVKYLADRRTRSVSA